MTQRNLSMKYKWTHRCRDQICGCQGGRGGREWIGSLGLTDANYYIQVGYTTVSYYITHGTMQYPETNHNGKEYFYIYLYN